MSLARLILPSRQVSKDIVVTGYSYTYSASIKSSQQRTQISHYPIKATQTGFNFTVKCRSEAEFQNLKQLVSFHQKDLLSAAITSDAFFRLIWAEQEIDYTFVVKSSPGGALRFQSSPDLPISTDLIYDNIFSVSNKFFDPGVDFNVLNGVVDESEFLKPIEWETRAPNQPTVPGRFDPGGGNGVGGI